MINLETWLPSNYEVNGRGWNVKDIGALGTGGRYVDLALIKFLISNILTAITLVVLFYTHNDLGSDGIFQNLLQIKALPLEIIGELLWAMWQETLVLRKLI